MDKVVSGQLEKMRITIIIILIFFGIHAKSQFVFINSKKYYDKDYFENNGKCYIYEESEKEYSIDSNYLENDYYEMEILYFSKNFVKFVVDESGIFLPYEIDDELKYFDHIQLEFGPSILKEHFTDINSIPNYLLDTIEIVRNQPIKEWYQKKDLLWCLRESEKEHIKLVLLKTDRIEHLKFKDKLVSVQVELKENDYINFVHRKDIFCPENIKIDLILALNNRLIEYGYLEKKTRNKYVPEVKEALIEFQKAMQLNYGFIDLETLNLLKITGFNM